MSSKCPGCNKTVYFAERQVKDGKDWHGQCLMRHIKDAQSKSKSPFDCYKSKGSGEAVIISTPIIESSSVAPSYSASPSPSPLASPAVKEIKHADVSSPITPVGGYDQEPESMASSSPRFCVNCGTPRASDARFCGSCGFKLLE